MLSALETRRWRWIAAGSVAAALLATSLLWQQARREGPATSACEQEVRSGNPRRGAEICLDSYHRSGEPGALVWAARGYLYDRSFDEAERLARELLDGPLRADGHGILSYIALRDGLASTAQAHAMLAFGLHVLAGDEASQVSDAVSLAQAAWKAGDFAASLAAADVALQMSRRRGYAAGEVAAQLARADALRRTGSLREAAEALRSAIAGTTRPCEQAWTRVKLAMYLMEAEQDGPALSELAAATEANRRCGAVDVATSIAINHAWLLRGSDPAAALARLVEVERVEGPLAETRLLRGYLAADRGALDEAERYLEEAERRESPDADWPWEIARSRAELAELRGGPFDDLIAENHYRRAIAMVAVLRATAQARSAYMVASHRGPYDGLMALLARQGRWRDVLAVVLSLDASDMLRATVDDGVARDHTSVSLAGAPAAAPALPQASVDDVLAAWRSRELVIAFAPSRRQISHGRERAYRLWLAGGQLGGEDVGEASAARAAAGALFVDPGNAAAAGVLGRVVVPRAADAPDRAAAQPRAALHVLAIGALGKAPLAALRDDDSGLSLGRRPLVRVLGLLARAPESRAAGAAVVIADPLHDLPNAAREGAVVAGAIGRGAQMFGPHGSPPATRDRLWGASDAAVLHVAAHVRERGRWRKLQLADGEVGPAEIVERRLAPRMAVLASCGSAAALDQEGWGSIAAALLESGTALVIATDRSIDDSASLALMRSFYAQPDWHADPARALARVQVLAARAAATDPDPAGATAWAAFSILGRPPAAPVHATDHRRDELPQDGAVAARPSLDLDPASR